MKWLKEVCCLITQRQGDIMSNANAIKYGSSNSAMGSGDPTGAMTSIPLSERMLQSQNKQKGLIVGALS